MNTETQHHFESWDGTKLFYRQWKGESQGDKKALIVMHRGHEHSGRLTEMVQEINADGEYDVFAYDSRGHGKSPGLRGYAKDFGYLIRDLNSFCKMIQITHNIREEDISVVASSVGAVVSSAWVHDYAPKIRAMVLAAPAFEIKLYVPMALFFLRILNMLPKKSFISSYVKSKMLTHDNEEAYKYDTDPLITKDISVNILIGLFDTAKRVLADAQAITTPTLIFTAGKDWVVKNKPQTDFFHTIGATDKEQVVLPGFFHSIMFERDRKMVFAKAKNFLRKCYDKKVDRSELTQAHVKGYTRSEYENLKEDLSPAKAMYYRWTIFLMKTLGRLSTGIRIGLSTGFDSGESLDYVYKNRASGITPIGIVIDYFYLNSTGWKYIRERKRNMDATLDIAINEAVKSGSEVQIMDVASGPGRYVLDALNRHRDKKVHALLCDNEQYNVDSGIKIAEEMNLQNVDFKVHDAFDKNSFNNLAVKPNIMIVSGLFELFPNNDTVRNTIEGIQECLATGGRVIYTGQPWHPQLELIAHTLNNRDNKPWIMRRRTQAEMDELFQTYGFEKQQAVVDGEGIFSVSIAKKKTSTAKTKTVTSKAKKKAA